MTEEEMRRMLTLAYAVIANADNILRDSRDPYAAMVRSQAEGWIEQYQELLKKELEKLGNQ